jgi:hypothetical protein
MERQKGGRRFVVDAVHAEIHRQIEHSEDVPDGREISDQNLNVVRQYVLDLIQE